MSARPARSVVPLVLFAAVLVVALNTWFAVSAVRLLLDSEGWLAHTWEVIGEEQHLMVTMSEAESAARGYLISDKDQFVQQYQQASQKLPAEIEQLQGLTSDNPIQQAALGQVRDLAAGRLASLQRAMDARREKGLEGVTPIMLAGVGAAEMDRLRSLVAEMDGEERRLLGERAVQARYEGRRTLFAIVLACVLDLLMIAGVSRYFAREREARVASERLAEHLAHARAEAERSAAEVHELNAELEKRVQERTAELETTNRELEAFSYSVSHDLRAPLRTIDGFSLALQEDYAEAIDDAGRDYINRVRAGVQRMGQLIDALLQLSRITRADLTRETVDLTALATQVSDALREENPDRKLDFNIQPGPSVEADPKLAQVALENLLGNAVKFTARREVAEIEFGWDAEQNAWRVRDNGAGFDMHYADKLFNAFNRLHGDKDFKGSGIGLATVARVIRRHHGRIWADSTVDHGATFWFTLG